MIQIQDFNDNWLLNLNTKDLLMKGSEVTVDGIYPGGYGKDNYVDYRRYFFCYKDGMWTGGNKILVTVQENLKKGNYSVRMPFIYDPERVWAPVCDLNFEPLELNFYVEPYQTCLF